jgi:Peptidase A4 family
MLRRMCISLAAIAVAAAPALTVLAAATSSADASVASPATTLAYHSGHALAIKHGFIHGAIRNGGTAVHLVEPGTNGVHSDTLRLNATATSTNWSGYAATGSTYTSVSASWVQPTGSCTSATRYSSFWVGLDGYSSNSVEQDGTDTDCSGGRAVYYGWYEMYPNPSFSFGDTVKAGDTMSASVTYTATNTYKLVLSDATQGWSVSTTQTLSGAPRSSAEVIIEAPCCTNSGGILPLANFGTVHLSNSIVDGSAIGTFSPVGITMIDNSGRDKDTITALSSNENFSATWVRAN